MKIKDLLNQVSETIVNINNLAIEKIRDPNTSDDTRAKLIEYVDQLNKLTKKYKD